MRNQPLKIATVTSVIAEAAEFVGAREAVEHSDGATPLATALIAAGARVEAMIPVVTLAKSLLLPGGLQDRRLVADLVAAIQRAETPPNTREHYEAMAREAQPAADEAEISDALSRLHRRAAHDRGGDLRSGSASAEINGREVTITVRVRPIPSQRTISVQSDYKVDGAPVRIPDLVRVIRGAA